MRSKLDRDLHKKHFSLLSDHNSAWMLSTLNNVARRGSQNIFRWMYNIIYRLPVTFLDLVASIYTYEKSTCKGHYSFGAAVINTFSCLILYTNNKNMLLKHNFRLICNDVNLNLNFSSPIWRFIFHLIAVRSYLKNKQIRGV